MTWADHSSELRERVAFDEVVATPDGYGGTNTTWVERVDTRARFIYKSGDEAVVSGGLTGRATFKVKLRSSIATRAITSDWRMRDVRRGIVFNVREVDAITDLGWVWIVAENGVAI